MDAALTFDDISPDYVSLTKLRQLIDFLSRANIPATLFIIPNSNGSHLLDEEYIDTLKLAQCLGNEIAMHGYKHGRMLTLKGIALKNEFGSLLPIPWPIYEKQKELIRNGIVCFRQKLGDRPVGFRAPSYLHNRVTFRVLKELGFSYDSSRTVFKPTHYSHFRIRTLHTPAPCVIEGIVEIPVTGDYTYGLHNCDLCAVLQRAIYDFRWARDFHGAFVINTHIQNIRRELDFLGVLVDRLDSDTTFVRLKDLTKMA